MSTLTKRQQKESAIAMSTPSHPAYKQWKSIMNAVQSGLSLDGINNIAEMCLSVPKELRGTKYEHASVVLAFSGFTAEQIVGLTQVLR